MLTCAQCRRKFERTNSRSRFCHPDCRKAHYNARRRTRPTWKRCPRRGCGVRFKTKPHPSFKGPHRDYCSPRCQRIVACKCYRANWEMKERLVAQKG